MIYGVHKSVEGTETTLACGCKIRTVGGGTIFAGTLRSYCDAHNPYKNAAPKVRRIL